MKKNLSLSLQFIVNCFLVAVFVNTVVSTFHIQHDKDLTFLQSIQVFLFTLGTSTLFFAATCVLLYLTGLLAGMGRERTFWLLMLVGLTATVVAYRIFKDIFYKYTEPGYIAGIAAFAIMVSLSSQYQLFHRIEYGNEHSELS